jgi:hypothetical protein
LSNEKAVNTRNDLLIATGVRSQNQSDATRRFGEVLTPGSRLGLFSKNKPDRFFMVIKYWMDETSGIAVSLGIGVPS